MLADFGEETLGRRDALEFSDDGEVGGDQLYERTEDRVRHALKQHLVGNVKVSRDPLCSLKRLRISTGAAVFCGRKEPDTGARTEAAGAAAKEEDRVGSMSTITSGTGRRPCARR